MVLELNQHIRIQEYRHCPEMATIWTYMCLIRTDEKAQRLVWLFAQLSNQLFCKLSSIRTQ